MNIRAQTDTDQVKVSYVGTRRDGTIFDQNEDIIFRLSDVIKGWAEGIKLIGKGGKIKLILHPDLAYEDKNLGKITPNSVLIFNIVLKDVIRDTDRDSD